MTVEWRRGASDPHWCGELREGEDDWRSSLADEVCGTSDSAEAQGGRLLRRGAFYVSWGNNEVRSYMLKSRHPPPQECTLRSVRTSGERWFEIEGTAGCKSILGVWAVFAPHLVYPTVVGGGSCEWPCRWSLPNTLTRLCLWGARISWTNGVLQCRVDSHTLIVDKHNSAFDLKVVPMSGGFSALGTQSRT